MTFEAWLTVGVIGAVIGGLLTNRISVDVAMLGGLTLLMVAGVLEPAVAVQGFSDKSIMMIAALFVVAAGLQETGGFEAIAHRLLGRPRTIAGAQLRLMVPVAAMSALMNNTPIVAMYLPIVNDWARKLRVSPSKLLMPLSFAAILGGKLTYIGTSSNIVVMGMYLAFLADPDQAAWVTQLGMADQLTPAAQFWGVAAIGVPAAIVGMAVIALTSRWLLPERRPADPVTEDARRYQVEMLVQDDSPIVGKSIEGAGLRHLPGLYLTEIERGEDRLPAVAPEEHIQAGDRLIFAGILESVVDLRKIRGLVPATDQIEKVELYRRQRTMVEAVVSHNSPLIGRTVRESKFRTKYNAAIVAVHRNGEHIKAKIGDIHLQPGDTLLLDTHSGFVDAFRNSDDFYLVSMVEGARPMRFERASLALGIMVVMIILLTTGVIPHLTAVFACAMAMIGTRCVTGTIARSSINWQVLLVIAAALGMGAALEQTGAATSIAQAIFDVCGILGLDGSPRAMFFVLFLVTSVFSQLITNNGSAVLMFPIVMKTAETLDVSPVPFVFGLMVAAGCSFMSPVGYQTNLMVYGPGGYRFTDYTRLGLPLTIAIAAIATLVAPIVFPFVN